MQEMQIVRFFDERKGGILPKDQWEFLAGIKILAVGKKVVVVAMDKTGHLFTIPIADVIVLCSGTIHPIPMNW